MWHIPNGAIAQFPQNRRNFGLTATRASGGGAPPVGISGATTDSGHKIVIPLPAGFLASNQTIVNPAMVTVEVDAPSVDATAANNTTTRTRRVGYRADVVGTDLQIWMAEAIPAVATAVRMTAAAGAITNGASSSAAFTSNVTNVAEENAAVIAHLLRFVDNAGGYGVAHSVMGNPFWIEGYAVHESGIACVKFDVVQGGTTRTSYAIIETRSRYRDSEIISPAQWTKNGGGGAGTQGGIGVYSSGQINPADFADGVATVTMTSYARIGGATVSRSQTWNVVMNAGGTYQQRIRYVDSVAGNDAWDGTTQAFVSGTTGPKATLQAAVLAAGSVTGGATTTSIPIVRCVGSGDTNNPRVYLTYTGSGSGNGLAGSTDTWLTIEPAVGHNGADTQIANYGTVSGLNTRIRRLRIRNMWWDIANLAGASGTSSSALISVNTTLYPIATNPEAVWFDGVESYHHLGRIGQITEGSSGSMIASSFSKSHLAFFTNFVVRDMARRGYQCSALGVVWNARFERIFKDVVKQPDCMVATVWRDNAVPTEFLPINTVTGTPAAGDTITGVYSTGSETVASYTPPNVQLTPGGNSYTFKADDSKQCRRITVGSPVGTFSAGQTITVGGSSFVVGRVEGNDLYLRTTSNVTNGQAITGPTGSGSVASNALAECLLFLPSGARGRAAPPHPDGLQIQDFVNQRIYFTSPVGTFQVGEAVTAPNIITTTVVAAVGANYIDVSGNHLKFFNPSTAVANGATITGATSGATATYNQSRSRFITNDKNILLYCILGENIDGQPLFGENGSGAVAAVNVSIVGTLGEGSLQTQFGSLSDVLFLHITHPNKRIAVRAVSGMTANGRLRSAVRWCVAEGFTSDTTPQGAVNGTDAWQAAADIRGCHALNTAPAFSEFDIGMSRGDALWTDGIGLLEDYDPARVTFQPGASSPVKSKVPAGQREVRYDLFGNERLDNGTASAGAVEEWGA